MKTVIEMARSVGARPQQNKNCDVEYLMDSEAIERLVEFARADEAEKYKWDVHSCGPTCTKAACVAMREAVEAEREACAKVCDEQAERSKLAMEKSKRTTDHAVYRAGAQTAAWNAAEIRARSNT